MTVVVGIDPSAKKVACVGINPATYTYLVEAYPLYGKGQTKQDNGSLGKAVEAMQDFVQQAQLLAGAADVHVYVENPVVGRGSALTTIKQAYVGGIIRGCLTEAGFTVYDVNLSTWRGKSLGVKSGAGRTTKLMKADTEQAVKMRDPKLHTLVRHDGDLIDAAGIALHAAEQARKAGVIGHAGPSGGSVQGEGPDLVVRGSRVRPGVRRR